MGLVGKIVLGVSAIAAIGIGYLIGREDGREEGIQEATATSSSSSASPPIFVPSTPTESITSGETHTCSGHNEATRRQHQQQHAQHETARYTHIPIVSLVSSSVCLDLVSSSCSLHTVHPAYSSQHARVTHSLLLLCATLFFPSLPSSSLLTLSSPTVAIRRVASNAPHSYVSVPSVDAKSSDDRFKYSKHNTHSLHTQRKFSIHSSSSLLHL